MKHQINVSCGGVGFLGLLTIVFITLKLCNVINWSWWWVTMPLWAFPVACLWGGGDYCSDCMLFYFHV